MLLHDQLGDQALHEQPLSAVEIAQPVALTDDLSPLELSQRLDNTRVDHIALPDDGVEQDEDDHGPRHGGDDRRGQELVQSAVLRPTGHARHCVLLRC